MKIGIIGGGIAGLSSAWALAKNGHEITLFEQAAIPNPLAASGDQHRIIRRAYGRMDGYARTIADAFRAWDELWDDLGASHYAATGILALCQTLGDEGDDYAKGYERNGTPHERYGARETEERYPFLDGGKLLYSTYCADGGVLFCERIARDLAAWLREKGARLLEGRRGQSVDAAAGSLVCEGEHHRFDRLVVTAGAWTPGLLPDLPDLKNTLTPYRTAVAYLTPPARYADAWAAAPAFVSVGGTVDGYILPPVDGTGLKFGSGLHKVKAAAGERSSIAPGEGETLRDYFSPPFRDIDRYAVASVRSCAYIFTRDEHFFGLSKGKALIVSARSGHGYKFGAAIGKKLAAAIETDDAPAFIGWLEARG